MSFPVTFAFLNWAARRRNWCFWFLKIVESVCTSQKMSNIKTKKISLTCIWNEDHSRVKRNQINIPYKEASQKGAVTEVSSRVTSLLCSKCSKFYSTVSRRMEKVFPVSATLYNELISTYFIIIGRCIQVNAWILLNQSRKIVRIINARGWESWTRVASKFTTKRRMEN